MRRKPVLLCFGLIALLVTFSLSHADDNTIYACYKKTDGQLKILKNGAQCLPSETALSWNKVGPPGAPGQPGANGVSVESTLLPQTDPNCPYGGIQFASASGITYACNGGSGEGSSPVLRQIKSAACSTGDIGWCPSYYRQPYFIIRDTEVKETSVVLINVLNPYIAYAGCEVNAIMTGEFHILCQQDEYQAGYVDEKAVLNYAVFNQ